MPSYTYNLGSKKHAFIDWAIVEPGYGNWPEVERVIPGDEGSGGWELPYGLRLRAHHPRVDLQPLVFPDRPWEVEGQRGIVAYCTLLEDEGRFRLYYGCHDASKGDDAGDVVDPATFVLAYAESTDGVNWVKPRIGTVRFDGSTDNNLVYGMDLALGRFLLEATVFKDPSAPPDQRYKLIHGGLLDTKPCLYGAVSPDGLRWSPLEAPLLPDYQSDTQTVARFDEEKGKYVGYFRGWSGTARGKWHGRRTIAYAETDRFDRWPVPHEIVAPDMHDSPDTDIYTNSYTPWPGADAHLMFPAIYEHRLDVVEVHMMTSRDGLRWQRPTRQAVLPTGEPGSAFEHSVYAGAGLASIKPGEWSLPISPRSRSHNMAYNHDATSDPLGRGYVCLATWREDGFMSLEVETQGGFTTVPTTFTGNRLELNAWTWSGGEILVELADGGSRFESSKVVPGRRFEDCDPISGDQLKRTVTWNGDSDVSAWSGKPVRLRFKMRRARLYAIQFVS